MLSSEGKSTNTEAVDEQVLIATQNQREREIDREQVFQLIESFLSFEACIHHRILPLAMESNKLLLGMVDQKDTSALDYSGSCSSAIHYGMIRVY